MRDTKYRGGAADDAVLQTMVLLSTLSTAAEVRHAARERRAGRDPSDQEAPAFVEGYLRGATAALTEMLMRLRAGLVFTQHHEEDRMTVLVRRFDDLMTLRRTAGLLQVVHQRLLSYYPAVSEAVVEEARLLHVIGGELLEADEAAYLDGLGPFLERALAFTETLESALRGEP